MTEEEARKKIEDANGDWEIFTRWISGQTCGLYENGMIDYYEFVIAREEKKMVYFPFK